MGVMKTPGVYIVEKNAFPNSVVEVATAVPVFIGYTEKAVNGDKSLTNKPWRLTSMADFRKYYGGPPSPVFEIAEQGEDATNEPNFYAGGKGYDLGQTGDKYMLFYSMMLFFQNGGGPCYIVSVGSYKDNIDAKKLSGGIEPLVKEQEPTMVVIPEAIRLDVDDCVSVQQAALAHCGGKMRSRITILDVWEGYKDRQDPSGDCVAEFRNKLGINFLDFSAAYYPWLHTTIVQDSDLSYDNIGNLDVLKELLDAEVDSQFTDLEGLSDDEKQSGGVKLRIAKQEQMKAEVAKLGDDALAPADKAQLHKTLSLISEVYPKVLEDVKKQLNLLPPAAAMAGVYTMVDNARGVWKAPANVSLNAVVQPAVDISHDEQEDLNVTTQGKSVNAIRSFVGEGTLVWGARTLDGNSLDWRYVNVRRTMIMLEESIRLAAKAYVFEPNVANTWVSINSMITNFLTGIWKRGGLAGSSPGDAFSVSVGLGSTMTPEDILEGILRVTVLVALVRPAEFIEITFQQKMQES